MPRDEVEEEEGEEEEDGPCVVVWADGEEVEEGVNKVKEGSLELMRPVLRHVVSEEFYKKSISYLFDQIRMCYVR